MRSFVVALLAILAMIASVGCGTQADEAAAPPTTVAEPTPTPTTREKAPPLSGVTLEGDAIALGELPGRPVLINVWSSW